MWKANIKPGTEYALREKRGGPVQRVRVLEHVRGSRWKAEWIDPNPGLVHYVESGHLIAPWKQLKALLREEESAARLHDHNQAVGFSRESPLDKAVGEVFESTGEQLLFYRGVLSGEREALDRVKARAKYSAQLLVRPFEQLLEAIQRESPSEERDARMAKIVVTAANVIYQSGRESANSGDAEAAYRRAADLYRSAASSDKWAAFGLAEVLNLSPLETDRADAVSIFRRVRQEAIEESVRREEPRTKVLARTTELICCLNVAEYQREADAIRSLVLQELGRVDERLTVYSQVQRRNVTKAQFQNDLDYLMNSEKRGVISAA